MQNLHVKIISNKQCPILTILFKKCRTLLCIWNAKCIFRQMQINRGNLSKIMVRNNLIKYFCSVEVINLLEF